MSTRINVSVDRGGLLQRNRQQTTANRLAALEEQQQERVQQQAEEQRQQRLQQEAAVPSPRRERPLREEPAAFRNLPKRIFFGPKYPPFRQLDPQSGGDYTGHSHYFLIDTVKGRGGQDTDVGLLANRWYLKADEFEFSYGEYGAAVYELGTGPGETNAMRLETGGSVFSGGVGFNAAVYDTYLGSPKDPPSLSNGPRTFECFVRVAGTNIGFEMWADCLYVRINASGVDVSELRFADVSTADSYLLPLTTANFSSWTHIAITVNDNEASLFVGGALIGRYTPANSSFNLNNKQLGIREFDVRTFASTIVAQLWVSSIRLTPRLLYTDSFTPPAKIQ